MGRRWSFPAAPVGMGMAGLGVPVQTSDSVGAPAPGGGTGHALEGSKSSQKKADF